MDREFVIRAASLYGPVTLALLLWYWRRPSVRAWAGMLVGWVWNASALLALNVIAQRVGWWHFEAQRALFFGMPIESYLGWTVLWGMLPQLAFPREPLPAALAFFVAFDFLFMPKMAPVLVLGGRWWVGECVGLAGGLLPAMLVSRWTARQERLYWRAGTQFVAFAALTLWLLPSVIFAARAQRWPQFPLRSWFVLVQFVCLAGLPGVAAVHEFEVRGRGTPLPYDPPSRLVITGPYAYVANPMQMGAALVLVAWGIGLRSGWVALAGVMAHVYSAGLANWDEREDLSARFGEPWRRYRREVRNWFPRWKPYVASPGELYVSETCGMCSEVKRWCERRGATGLEIRAAESYPGRLMRITYVHADGETESGIAAMARAVEHINLAWAYAGWCARLPVIKQTLQVLVDACGGGPREMAEGGPESQSQNKTKQIPRGLSVRSW